MFTIKNNVMFPDFNKYALKGYEFVQLVAEDLSIPPEKAGRITRAVLHAFRNRLTHEESFHLIAQLPMALKGLYVDGWHFDKPYERINTLTEFLDEIRREDGKAGLSDFGNDNQAAIALISVCKAVNYFVSGNEWEHVMNMLPKELSAFIHLKISGDGLSL